MKTQIVAPGEFLAVRHSVLNGNTYDIGRLIEDTLSLGKYISGRIVVPCFEGDILQVGETGEVVLTHQDFFPLSQERYRNLKERKLATSLKEVLDKVADDRQKGGDQRVVLCFDLKGITSKATIGETVRTLNEYRIEDAYFDSSFGGKLDKVQEANDENETDYAKSLHLIIGNIFGGQLMAMRPRKGYDILTVPYIMSLGDVGEPVIYGAVGSNEILERIAEKPHVQGAYIRFEGGSGLKGAFVKLWNALTNTERLRQTHISKYSIA